MKDSALLFLLLLPTLLLANDPSGESKPLCPSCAIHYVQACIKHCGGAEYVKNCTCKNDDDNSRALDVFCDCHEVAYSGLRVGEVVLSVVLGSLVLFGLIIACTVEIIKRRERHPLPQRHDVYH